MGLGASAAIHLLAVVLYPLLVDRGAPPAGPPVSVTAPAPQGIQVVRIREVPDGTEPVAPEPEPEPEPVPARPAAEPSADRPVEAPLAPPTEPAAAVDGLSVAERLRPRVTDPRFWEVDAEAIRLSDEQLVRLELLWSIVALNDSSAAAAARARALTDWTFTDEDGKRWGVADGRVYVAGVALPLPFGFGGPLIPGSPAAQRAWMDGEIDRAAGNAVARENMNQRIRAIRERLDRERERRRLQADSTGRPPPVL